MTDKKKGVDARTGTADAEKSEAPPVEAGLDEAQRAGQRRPEPSDAALIFAIKETDDVVVRTFKRTVQAIAERWRTLVVVGVLAMIIVLAVAITLSEARSREAALWREVTIRTTVPELETLIGTHAGRPTLPTVYDRLIERLREQAADADGDRTRALERLVQRIPEYLNLLGTDPRHATEVRRLQIELARAERDLAVLKAIAAEAEEAGETERPEPRVYEPVIDDQGSYAPLPNPVVVFEAEDGTTFRFELFQDDAPNTVANIIWLINRGYYDSDGPGGWMSTAGSDADPRQRLIGQFVAHDRPGQTHEELSEGDQPLNKRVARLNEKWHDTFAARSVGYTLPFELSGARVEVLNRHGYLTGYRNRPVRAGDLVMDLQTSADALRTPKPDTAEAAFRVVRNRMATYDGRYVVFGRIADEESARAIDTLKSDVAIRKAYVEALRPKLREREVTVRDTLRVPELDDLMERFEGDAERAEAHRNRARAAIEALARPALVMRDVRGNLRPAPTPERAENLVLHPAQLERVPAGLGYLDANGDAHVAPDDDYGYVDWFAEREDVVAAHGLAALVPPAELPEGWVRGGVFPGIVREDALVLLPIRTPVLDADGGYVAAEYRPMVRYFHLVDTDDAPTGPADRDGRIRFPALLPASETPPSRMATIDLFPTRRLR